MDTASLFHIPMETLALANSLSVPECHSWERSWESSTTTPHLQSTWNRWGKWGDPFKRTRDEQGTRYINEKSEIMQGKRPQSWGLQCRKKAGTQRNREKRGGRVGGGGGPWGQWGLCSNKPEFLGRDGDSSSVCHSITNLGRILEPFKPRFLKWQ